MASAAKTNGAIARNIIEIKHKTATSIGSLVYPPVQSDDLMTPRTPDDDHSSRLECGLLYTDLGINRTE